MEAREGKKTPQECLLPIKSAISFCDGHRRLLSRKGARCSVKGSLGQILSLSPVLVWAASLGKEMWRRTDITPLD